jgi:hypothetical protein
VQLQTIGTVPFYTKGSSPKLVIHSGTHGDEYSVIAPLKETVLALEESLPSFIYIPAVSPTAVAAKSRKNAYGNDINRGFGRLDDSEVRANKEIAALAHGAVVISFHQDLERDEFYMYDSGVMDESLLQSTRNELQLVNVPLFDGIDDPDDVALSYYIKNGYVDTVGCPAEEGQFIEDWAIYKGYYSRFLTIEIPRSSSKMYDIFQVCIKLALKLIV